VKNGSTVAAFEREFAAYVGAKYAIALCNGTATLHTALIALGVKPGDRVPVPPLTMSATTIAVLHAGAVPVFCDIDKRTWLMNQFPPDAAAFLPVSLYGLNLPWSGGRTIVDAAQTLRVGGTQMEHPPAFLSYSFQASKILPLGEGGMLVTNDEELATCAREFSSLGYRMRADQPRIDPAVLKSPTYERHHSMGYNYRMNDVTADFGLRNLERYGKMALADAALHNRRAAAALYRQSVAGCSWITPQHVPDGWTHDYWCYTVALASADLWHPFVDAIVRHGGERPYAAWKLTYEEPAFVYLDPRKAVTHRVGNEVHFYSEFTKGCPVAEDLQPRLVQFQTNDIRSAERNAEAIRRAIHDLGELPH